MNRTVALQNATLARGGRLEQGATLLLSGDAIADIAPGTASADDTIDLTGHYVLPGFIDVHVHGLERLDSLDANAPVAEMAARLVRYGVTGFCPTTVACAPQALRAVLQAVREAREAPGEHAARVLRAHLESNFINPDFRGAQPLEFIIPPYTSAAASEFSGEDILGVVREYRDSVGIVTLAPEIDGGIDLVRELVRMDIGVSLGHSGATYDEARGAIAAGARQATHLFNRMPPLHHREPGLAGAVLDSDEVTAEIVCDGYHVHPAVVSAVVRAKGPAQLMAITDGTSAAGLEVGAHAELGGRRITAREAAAFLDDGTLAGSVLTMDRALRMLVHTVGVPLPQAALMCATTPARELGLARQGTIEPGAVADLVVLDEALNVVQTWIGGRAVYGRTTAA